MLYTHRLFAGECQERIDAVHAEIAQRAAPALLRIEHPRHAPVAIAARVSVDDAAIDVRDTAAIAERLR